MSSLKTRTFVAQLNEERLGSSIIAIDPLSLHDNRRLLMQSEIYELPLFELISLLQLFLEPRLTCFGLIPNIGCWRVGG